MRNEPDLVTGVWGMSDKCCGAMSATGRPPVDPLFRRVLWVALLVNTVMGLVEITGGFSANSVSLLADAVDFLGDAANYGLSLYVLALAPVWRSRVAAVKGVTMAVYGIFVLGKAVWNAATAATPNPLTMGAIGFLALVANVSVAVLLYRFRDGDANSRSVWLCSRNDAIVNLTVMLAALGVLSSGTAWPDLVVAVGIATLALAAAGSVLRQARAELRGDRRLIESA